MFKEYKTLKNLNLRCFDDYIIGKLPKILVFRRFRVL